MVATGLSSGEPMPPAVSKEDVMKATESLFDASYLPQLMAAIERHEDCENWCTWDNVVNAAQAVRGDEIAQRHLSEDAAWRLDAEGRLP